MTDSESLEGFADALEEKAGEHEHYRDFAADDAEANQHHGAALAFRFVADKLHAAVDAYA